MRFWFRRYLRWAVVMSLAVLAVFLLYSALDWFGGAEHYGDIFPSVDLPGWLKPVYMVLYLLTFLFKTPVYLFMPIDAHYMLHLVAMAIAAALWGAVLAVFFTGLEWVVTYEF